MSTRASPSGQYGSPKAQRLVSYFRDELEERSGDLYVKGKFIANDVDLSPKEIGALMVQLQESVDDLEIEKWSYTSATTWRVAKRRNHGDTYHAGRTGSRRDRSRRTGHRDARGRGETSGSPITRPVRDAGLPSTSTTVGTVLSRSHVDVRQQPRNDDVADRGSDEQRRDRRRDRRPSSARRMSPRSPSRVRSRLRVGEDR